MNGWTKGDASVQWKIIQTLKGSSDMLQHGWTLKTLYEVKEARHKRTKIVWFHLDKTPRIGKFRDTESGFGYQWLGDQELLAKDYRDLSGGESYENRGEWVHNTVNVIHATKLYTYG